MNTDSIFSFYIATGLDNRKAFAACRAAVEAVGGTITFDWSDTEPVGIDDAPDSRAEEILQQRAVDDLGGVMRASVLIKLLPGSPPRFKSSGRGSHTELGAALAVGVPAVLVSPDPFDQLADGGTRRLCVFYSHDGVAERVHVADDDGGWSAVADIAKKVAMSSLALQLRVSALHRLLETMGLVRAFTSAVAHRPLFAPCIGCGEKISPLQRAEEHLSGCPVMAISPVWLDLVASRPSTDKHKLAFPVFGDNSRIEEQVLCWIDQSGYPPPSAMAVAIRMVRQGIVFNNASNPIEANALATWSIHGWVDKGCLKDMLYDYERDHGERPDAVSLVKGVALDRCSACGTTRARSEGSEDRCESCGKTGFMGHGVEFYSPGRQTCWASLR